MESPDHNLLSRLIHALVVLLAITALGAALFTLVATAGLYGMIPDSVVNGFNLTLPWLMLLGVAGAIWKKLPYLVALPVVGACSAFLLYLAWDNTPPMPPIVMPKMASKDSKSYATYQWLLKTGPGSRLNEIAKRQAELPYFPTKREEWAAFVQKNREVFDEAWTSDTLGREWIEAMAANAPDGVYPNEGVEAPTLSFAVIKRAAQIHWAHAQLLLLDGQGDDAARTLTALLRAGYHLQQGGTSLVNQMIASVYLKGTYERFELVADSDTMSVTTRAEVAAALREAPAVTQNIAQAFLGEEILARSYIVRMRGDYLEAISAIASTENSRFSSNRFLGRFLFNPKQTEREYVTFLADSCRLAQQRRLSASTQGIDEFEARINRKSLKNPVGQRLAAMAFPAFAKISEAFWKAEAQRQALLTRLTAQTVVTEIDTMDNNGKLDSTALRPSKTLNDILTAL